MDHPGAAPAEVSSAPRSTRATMARSPRRAERDPLDPPDWRAVAGSPQPLSVVSNLSSPLPSLGPRRHTAARPEGPGGRSPRPRRAGPERDLHRRLLCERQKKGRCVGKTKRGKGTKIMAIADRAGLPLAITIASASPHETQLVA